MVSTQCPSTNLYYTYRGHNKLTSPDLRLEVKCQPFSAICKCVCSQGLHRVYFPEIDNIKSSGWAGRVRERIWHSGVTGIISNFPQSELRLSTFIFRLSHSHYDSYWGFKCKVCWKYFYGFLESIQTWRGKIHTIVSPLDFLKYFIRSKEYQG